jgi:dihydroorotate dehydrogenase
VHLGPSGVGLSGDIKGSSSLTMIREIQLQPKLRISYVGGQSVEFGKLPNQCAEKVRAAAKALSVVTRSSDG